jgi:hypothetical protein
LTWISQVKAFFRQRRAGSTGDDLTAMERNLERIRQDNLNLRPDLKAKITPRIKALYVRSGVAEIIYENLYSDLRASGGARIAGALKRAKYQTYHTFSNALDIALYGKLTPISTSEKEEFFKCVYYLQEETRERIKEETRKTVAKRYPWASWSVEKWWD